MGGQAPCAETDQATVRSADWWDQRYQDGDVPWDTGITPPEVVALVSGSRGAAGWALDLGCGTGLNTRYLAQHGYKAIGIDLAHSALVRARQAAQAEGLPAFFCCADVTDLSFLALQASLALDIGCFHALDAEHRARYIASLAARLAPGARYLLYAHRPQAQEQNGPYGASPRDIAEFAPFFDLLSVRCGEDRARAAAWHLMRRR